METEVNELILEMEHRKAQYDFLQIVFSEPLTIEQLQTWKNQQININREYDSFCEDLASQQLAEVAEREKGNFMQLFIGPGSILAPPWESVYRTRERLLFGEPTLKLREKLREFQLQYETRGNEPEDHITIELELMSYLIQVAIEAIQQQDDIKKFVRSTNAQMTLLEQHLLNWIEPFANDILSATTSSLYKGSALFLTEWIKKDYQYLNKLKEVIES